MRRSGSVRQDLQHQLRGGVKGMERRAGITSHLCGGNRRSPLLGRTGVGIRPPWLGRPSPQLSHPAPDGIPGWGQCASSRPSARYARPSRPVPVLPDEGVGEDHELPHHRGEGDLWRLALLFLPPWMKLRPFHAPDSRVTGASPARLAVHGPVSVPSSSGM